MSQPINTPRHRQYGSMIRDVTSQVVQQLTKNTTSVFGAAPSLSQMRAMNEMNKDKKILFRGATFWYYFRVYYPYLCPTIFLTFMIISLTAWNTIEGHLMMGSILSLIGGLSVLCSYIMIIPWQKHPSVLVVYRTLTNMIFSLVIIFEVISRKKESCRNFAVATNYILLASESWLTTIASDLVHSLTNPFASYKANLRRYHVLVWTLSGLLSFIFYFDKACQGRFNNSVCWVKVTSTNEPCLWGYYLFWIVCMYAYQMWAFIFAYFRLRRGLSVTFEVRKKTAQETFKCLASYAVYLSLLVFFFAIISSDPSPQPHSSMANFSLFFLFVIANRGTVDSMIWFMLHDFQRDALANSSQLPLSQVDLDHEKGIISPQQQQHRHSGGISHITADIQDISKQLVQVDLKKTVTTAVTDIADLAIAEFDESDLSPQVNMALRQQIVQYVTTGVRDSILQQNLQTHKKQNRGIDSFMERMMNPRTKDPAVVAGISVLKFYIEGEHPFKAFGVDVFRDIRMREGISDDHYLQSLSKPANERLSEGASGAFMFFCGGGEFIVKTIRAREARVLHQSLDQYTSYLKENKVSFLCRFVGSYSLRLYDQTFYFVVMMNCFDPHAKINERYDIKGSWVGRSADPASSKQTKRVVCRHCNTYFIPIQQQQCTVIVGLHEPNVVLKDNDLRARISLDPKEAVDVINILKRDSDLLGKLGVLDYSLLAGVKKYKFSVDVTDEEIGLTNSADLKEIYSQATYKAKAVTGPAVYYLGIVDFLQDWTTKKKIERLFKIYIGRKDADGLSVMEPIAYMNRFQHKMLQIFDTEGVSSSTNQPNMPTSASHDRSKAAQSNSKNMNFTAKDDNDDNDERTMIVKKHHAYQVLQEETSNPLFDDNIHQIQAKLVDAPPLLPPRPQPQHDVTPPRRRNSHRSMGSGSNYGDDNRSVTSTDTERLRRGLTPAMVVDDPYQYVYDAISSGNTPTSASLGDVVEVDDVVAPASPVYKTSSSIISPSSPSRNDSHSKNTEYNEYVELSSVSQTTMQSNDMELHNVQMIYDVTAKEDLGAFDRILQSKYGRRSSFFLRGKTGRELIHQVQSTKYFESLHVSPSLLSIPTKVPVATSISTPTQGPTIRPTGKPVIPPTRTPTRDPTIRSTNMPVTTPTARPTGEPTIRPTGKPVIPPTRTPTRDPTIKPTNMPVATPTARPTGEPTIRPTGKPVIPPTRTPTRDPTIKPTNMPVATPTARPTGEPTIRPTGKPVIPPTRTPTRDPTIRPTGKPVIPPTARPTGEPTIRPTRKPTTSPTLKPSGGPTIAPTGKPTASPTAIPTNSPTLHQPSPLPSIIPTVQPTIQPSSRPTTRPTTHPTSQPSAQPSSQPSSQPSTHPSNFPSMQPTSQPSSKPSCQPSSYPSMQPSSQPSAQPSAKRRPSRHPTPIPIARPTRAPSSNPTSLPTTVPISTTLSAYSTSNTMSATVNTVDYCFNACYPQTITASAGGLDCTCNGVTAITLFSSTISDTPLATGVNADLDCPCSTKLQFKIIIESCSMYCLAQGCLENTFCQGQSTLSVGVSSIPPGNSHSDPLSLIYIYVVIAAIVALTLAIIICHYYWRKRGHAQANANDDHGIPFANIYEDNSNVPPTAPPMPTAPPFSEPLPPEPPAPEPEPEDNSCVICMFRDKDTTFLCGHICVCQICSNLVNNCPICRSPITARIRVFT